MNRYISNSLDLTAVRTVGAAMPADVFVRMVDTKSGLPGLKADDYDLELGVSPTEAANRAWSVLTGAWQGYTNAREKLPGGDRATSLTREKWLLVLLRELGFGRVPVTGPGGIRANESAFPVSHVAGPVPVHLLGWDVDLDHKTPGLAGAADRAPHAMVQDLLNRSDDYLWSIVANGSTLRLLRDSSTIVGQSFVEFDLAAIFEGELFPDFLVFFLLCHHSRFQPTEDAGNAGCWLEQWRTHAAETGARALGELRSGVKDAIEILGTGFLRHPGNSELRQRLEDHSLVAADFHRSMLRLVYRLLFLFVAEDRGILLDPKADPVAAARYRDWFSTGRLRTVARLRRGTRHDDHWQGLRLVLDGLGTEDGLPELGLPGLGGIFETSPDDMVADCALSNAHLLQAIRYLGFIEATSGGRIRRVDYRNLGAEELGGVYESLLELVPRIDPVERVFTLPLLAGNERKTTGAHYTPTPLIDAVLESSLDYLLDKAQGSSDPEAALLALRLCDPAVGSGHFLVAAARRIANRLARVRSDGGEPSVAVIQAAIRDVIGRCVYGIDINPMAVELCKVSLWLEAVEPGKPLGFLDHHIVNGNGLVGVTPRLLADGIPDSAFTAIEGDDKPTVSSRRKTNAFQRDGRNQQILSFALDPTELSNAVASAMAEIEALPDDTTAQVAKKETLFHSLETSGASLKAHLAADAWCAAIVSVKAPGRPAITDDTVRTAGENPAGLTTEQRIEIELLADEYQFVHWHLAFPQIFRVDLDEGGPAGWVGGFDLLLGNPPWDTLSPDAKEFFSAYEPQIRFQKRDEQNATIERLEESTAISDTWGKHRRHLFALVHFIKASGRYRMFAQGNLGKGDFNVYRMFVETALTMTNESGWAAQVAPSGLYNGANAAGIRRELFEAFQLRRLVGLVNNGGYWFPGVHPTFRFAIYSASQPGPTGSFPVSFGVKDASMLVSAMADPVMLSVEAVRAQSPDALAISETKPGPDADITAKIYSVWPPFGEKVSGEPFRRFQREIDMGADRNLFDDRSDGLPLYEGRMIDQYDHRAKAYRSGRGRAAVWEVVEFGSDQKAIVPQWRVRPKDVPAKVGERVDRYRIAFCDVTAPDAQRSLVAALVPPGVICGHTAPTITFEEADWRYALFLATANSFVADFIIRKKVTLHVTISILDSLPFPRLEVEDPVLAQLAILVSRLTCTSPEMSGFWNAMSGYGWCEPVSDGAVPKDALIGEAVRHEARSEIDAILAKHIYGLNRIELAYILDQFPALERRELKANGSFATRDRVLGWFDRV